MEASTVQEQDQPAPEQETAPAEPERSGGEDRDSSRLFTYARYVHVGVGAAECIHREDGACTNSDHVHVWCRLPNPFQRNSIAEKATAARARRMRQLHDTESDTRTILDEAIATQERAGDREGFIEEIASADFMRDHLDAVRAAQEDEEFEHIEDDQERLRALREMDPEDRSEEEITELESHVIAFNEVVTQKRDEKQQPLRASLQERPTEELVELVREQRMANIAGEQFQQAYSRFEWYLCTLKPRDPNKGLPKDRYFSDINDLVECPAELYEALDRTFMELEAAQGRALSKS